MTRAHQLRQVPVAIHVLWCTLRFSGCVQSHTAHPGSYDQVIHSWGDPKRLEDMQGGRPATVVVQSPWGLPSQREHLVLEVIRLRGTVVPKIRSHVTSGVVVVWCCCVCCCDAVVVWCYGVCFFMVLWCVFVPPCALDERHVMIAAQKGWGSIHGCCQPAYATMHKMAHTTTTPHNHNITTTPHNTAFPLPVAPQQCGNALKGSHRPLLPSSVY